MPHSRLDRDLKRALTDAIHASLSGWMFTTAMRAAVHDRINRTTHEPDRQVGRFSQAITFAAAAVVLTLTLRVVPATSDQDPPGNSHPGPLPLQPAAEIAAGGPGVGASQAGVDAARKTPDPPLAIMSAPAADSRSPDAPVSSPRTALDHEGRVGLAAAAHTAPAVDPAQRIILTPPDGSSLAHRTATATLVATDSRESRAAPHPTPDPLSSMSLPTTGDAAALPWADPIDVATSEGGQLADTILEWDRQTVRLLAAQDGRLLWEATILDGLIEKAMYSDDQDGVIIIGKRAEQMIRWLLSPTGSQLRADLIDQEPGMPPDGAAPLLQQPQPAPAATPPAP